MRQAKTKKQIKKKIERRKVFSFYIICFRRVSQPYLWVGKLQQHLNCDNSCEFPILHDCIVISMSRSPHNPHWPTISGLFLAQMLSYEVLLRLLHIQAGDKLHQRPLSPMNGHRWFPIHLCTALQHDQSLANCWNPLNGQLFDGKQKQPS